MLLYLDWPANRANWDGDKLENCNPHEAIDRLTQNINFKICILNISRFISCDAFFYFSIRGIRGRRSRFATRIKLCIQSRASQAICVGAVECGRTVVCIKKERQRLKQATKTKKQRKNEIFDYSEFVFFHFRFIFSLVCDIGWVRVERLRDLFRSASFHLVFHFHLFERHHTA